MTNKEKAIGEKTANKFPEAPKNEHHNHLFHKHEEHALIAKKGYVLSEIIGEGSYAKVYKTEYTDSKTGKSITLAEKDPKGFLKKVFPSYVMSRVNHRNIIRLHSVIDVKVEDKFYVFMQMATNGDLLEFVKLHGAIVEEQARIWFTQFTRGMKYLHGLNIAHRDIKMENLLLTQAYNIKISDFGFSRLVLEEGPVSETFCGSICYAPPEILRGRKYNPKLSDIWSMGVVLYVMVNKSLPFDDKSIKSIYEAQMSKNWRLRDRVRNKLSISIKALIGALLEPLAVNRIASVEELWKHAWIQTIRNPEIKRDESQRTVRVHESISKQLPVDPNKKDLHSDDHPLTLETVPKHKFLMKTRTPSSKSKSSQKSETQVDRPSRSINLFRKATGSSIKDKKKVNSDTKSQSSVLPIKKSTSN